MAAAWMRFRYGVEGLSTWVSTGRPPEISAEVRGRILALTRQSPPEKTGLSQWSSREMARYLNQKMGISVSHNFVAALWREYDLQPHRQGTFTLSADPDFEEKKVVDVVGLYLDPPMGAVVLSIDEKTQIQALDRIQPLLPMTFSKTEKRTYNYRRHGTTNLFAALDTTTGEVLGWCCQRRRTKEFLTFMDQKEWSPPMKVERFTSFLTIFLPILDLRSISGLLSIRTSPSTLLRPAALGLTR